MQITHRNIVAGIAALVQYTEHIGIEVTHEDCTLSYLPLAHIFDRIVEEFALFAGARIGYSQVCLEPQKPCSVLDFQTLPRSLEYGVAVPCAPIPSERALILMHKIMKLFFAPSLSSASRPYCMVPSPTLGCSH